MMDDHHHSRRNVENREILAALSALALPKLEVHAARQLQHMSHLGALLAEAVETPVLIKNPLGHPSDVALVTSRWLGGGIFGVVFPLPDGTLESGFMSMRDILAANPHLTPSGTIAHQRWDLNVATKRDHLLPQHATVMEAVRKISRSLAATLLESYPDRIDLTIRTDTPLSEIRELLEFSRLAIRELHAELQKGLSASGPLREDENLLSKAVELRYLPKVQKIALEEALTIFRNSQVRKALTSYEKGNGAGIVEDLIEVAANAAASHAAPVFQDIVVRDPFGRPRSSTLRDASVAGLSEACAQNREFRLLWHHLGEQDRAKISKIIGKRAWTRAVTDYVRTN